VDPREISAGKLFVGDKRVRTELSQQGQQIIRITDEDRGVEWMLFPDRKKYMERPLGGPGGAIPGTRSIQTKNPCSSMPGLTCRQLGEEKISGRTAVKWEMVDSQQKQTMKSTQWIDKERGVPLRQEMFDGQTTELKFVATEELNGRRVEKWDLVATMPGRPETRTFSRSPPVMSVWPSRKGHRDNRDYGRDRRGRNHKVRQPSTDSSGCTPMPYKLSRHSAREWRNPVTGM